MRTIWFQYLESWQRHGWTMKDWFSRQHKAGSYRSTDPLNSGGLPMPCNSPNKTLFDVESASSSEKEDGDDDDYNSDNNIVDNGWNTARKVRKNNKRPRNSSLTGAREKVVGLAPSKPLLLGFLYLACRHLRSWVIPADLVRWCADGVLPLNNLWESECIPAEYKKRFSSVPKSFEKRYF